MAKYEETLIPKLVKLGLTPQEARIYLMLLNSPLSKVKDIANDLGLLIPSVHRSLTKLKQNKIIISYGGKPFKFQAMSPSFALQHLIQQVHQEQLVLKTEIENTIQQKRPTEELLVEYLEGKQAIFNHALPIIKQIKKEILILSIGEPIPQEIFVSITQAGKRGATIKMLAERYGNTNKNLLHNWQKNGWMIRHLEKPVLDFTLTIYDTKICVIQVRRKEAKEQRAGIAFHNPAYSQAQKQYFEQLWKQSKKINQF